ncbi:MAG: response regulator, partial [Maricaulaceae bacterium]
MTGLNNLQVLVVEDNQHMTTILRIMLRAIDIWQVVEARDAAEAFEFARDRMVDLALVDFALGDLNALEFTKLIRTAQDSPNPYLPIILVTAHADRRVVMQAVNTGVNAVLAKPVSARALFERIQAIVDKPRNFIRAPNYFGPDRRRPQAPTLRGPWRRSTQDAHEQIDNLSLQEHIKKIPARRGGSGNSG